MLCSLLEDKRHQWSDVELHPACYNTDLLNSVFPPVAMLFVGVTNSSLFGFETCSNASLVMKAWSKAMIMEVIGTGGNILLFNLNRYVFKLSAK